MPGSGTTIRWPLGTLGLIAMMAFAACSGSATPTAGVSTGPTASSSVVAPTTPPTSAASASTGTVTLPVPEVSAVKVGLLQATTGHDAEVAIEDGLFTKNGLTVTYSTFTSQGSEITALLAGQIDMALNIGVAEDIASQTTNTPLVVVMTEKDNLSDNLYTLKSITSAAQLKGHAIAISSFGSVTYGEALIALKSLGLAPTDVTITPIGNDAARRAALAAGSVGASLDDQSELASMTAGGFNDLVQLSQLTYGLPVGDAITTKAYAQKNPNTVLAVVASLIEGVHRFLSNPSDAEQAAVKFENIDLATATTNVQGDLPLWSPVDGRPKLADFQAAQALYSKTEPTIASIDVTQTFTTQFCDQLKSLGWYQAMGVPTP
jgi:ABC-type nitrate/sulfonate/bicarbonate transport system substrate-binding protein